MRCSVPGVDAAAATGHAGAGITSGTAVPAPTTARPASSAWPGRRTFSGSGINRSPISQPRTAQLTSSPPARVRPAGRSPARTSSRRDHQPVLGRAPLELGGFPDALVPGAQPQVSLHPRSPSSRSRPAAARAPRRPRRGSAERGCLAWSRRSRNVRGHPGSRSGRVRRDRARTHRSAAGHAGELVDGRAKGASPRRTARCPGRRRRHGGRSHRRSSARRGTAGHRDVGRASVGGAVARWPGPGGASGVLGPGRATAGARRVRGPLHRGAARRATPRRRPRRPARRAPGRGALSAGPGRPVRL